jgi:hypothetical protein
MNALTAEAKDRLDNFFIVIRAIGYCCLAACTVMILFASYRAVIHHHERLARAEMLSNLATCSGKVVYQSDSYPYVEQYGKKVWLYEEGCK